MTAYEIYTFVLCLVVIVALTALFIFFLTYLLRFYFKLVRNGVEDTEILNESRVAKKITPLDVINNVVSWVLCMGLLVAFALSLFIQSTEAEFVGNLPSLCVVKSASMSYREEKNEYLFANDLQDQFDTFDIIFLSPLPDEYELKLYDIVVYEAKDGTRIVHRIVGIEEPNAEHPGCRYFRLQGDAVQVSDKYPVLYTQMRGIYSGERIRFVGSFVMFMQSPAGYICILLVLLAIVSTPIVEKRIEKEKQKRLAAMEAPSKEADHA